MIEVENLSKTYRRRRHQPQSHGRPTGLLPHRETIRALDGISFSIATGESVGYIGLNGAGKSTTIKILTGVLVPDQGNVHVNGLIPWRDHRQNALQIGAVFGQRSQLWWDLPLVESLRLISKMYRMTPDVYRRNLAHLTDLLDLNRFMYVPVRTLSLGQRMRGELAAAMIYQPQILYLDEPTAGLDAIAKSGIRSLVRALNQQTGSTIMLASHDLSDVERLCNRILLLSHGRILYDGSLRNFKSHHAPYRSMMVRFDSKPRLAIAGIPGVIHLRDDGNLTVFDFDPNVITPTDLLAAAGRLSKISDISFTEPRLEDIILRLHAATNPRSSN